MRLRMETIKSTALLRSYSTSPMVLALAIVLDLALPLYGVSNCVWLAVSSCIQGAKMHRREGGANAGKGDSHSWPMTVRLSSERK